MARTKGSKNKVVKKHKYTRKNTDDHKLHEQVAKQYMETAAVNETTTESPRASSESYVFFCGNKVLVRNLTDETLNERFEQTFISACEARRQANHLEQLEYNLAMEQRYRGLK